MKRLTVTDIQRRYEAGERLTMLTAYDYPTARLADQAGVPLLLVGDSLGMVVLGYESTLQVTVDDMCRHGAAVVRGVERAHVVVDMPFGSYQTGWRDAVRNATRLIRETGADAVKLEGGTHVAPTVRRIVEAGIPVMGHIGLTPQSVNALGGFRVQGKTPRDAVRLINDAHALQEAGAYAVVIETVPAAVGSMVTQRLGVPTIGIGAGPYCSGQVQVLHDLLGLYEDFVPKHARQFMQGAEAIRAAITAYREAVEAGRFPTERESFYLDARVRDLVERMVVPVPPGSEHEGVEAGIAMAEADLGFGDAESAPYRAV